MVADKNKNANRIMLSPLLRVDFASANFVATAYALEKQHVGWIKYSDPYQNDQPLLRYSS